MIRALQRMRHRLYVDALESMKCSKNLRRRIRAGPATNPTQPSRRECSALASDAACHHSTFSPAAKRSSGAHLAIRSKICRTWPRTNKPHSVTPQCAWWRGYCCSHSATDRTQRTASATTCIAPTEPTPSQEPQSRRTLQQCIPRSAAMSAATATGVLYTFGSTPGCSPMHTRSFVGALLPAAVIQASTVVDMGSPPANTARANGCGAQNPIREYTTLSMGTTSEHRRAHGHVRRRGPQRRSLATGPRGVPRRTRGTRTR